MPLSQVAKATLTETSTLRAALVRTFSFAWQEFRWSRAAMRSKLAS